MRLAVLDGNVIVPSRRSAVLRNPHLALLQNPPNSALYADLVNLHIFPGSQPE